MTHPSDDELEAMAALLQNVSNDALYNGLFGISRILAEAAAMLRACKGRVRVKSLEWLHCTDGTLHDAHCQYETETDGGYWRVIKGVTGGTSYLCHTDTLEAAKAAAQADYEARIFAALEPAPDHAEWNAAIEAAKAVVRLVNEDCFAPMTRTREEAFSAACGEVERQIGKLKKGPDHDASER